MWFILAQETVTPKAAEGWVGFAETVAGLSAPTLLALMVIGLVYIIWWRLIPDIKTKDTIIAEFEKKKALELQAKDIAHEAALKDPESKFKEKFADAERDLADKRARMSAAMLDLKTQHEREKATIRSGFVKALDDLRKDLTDDVNEQKATVAAIKEEYTRRLDKRDAEYLAEVVKLTAALTTTNNQGVRVETLIVSAMKLINRLEAKLSG